MKNLVTGIQQAGIGVQNADEAKILYRDLFGLNVLVFDDVAPACLMTKYTGNEVHKRRAILSLNMKGGGGFEIWQFSERKPRIAKSPPRIGDLGIFALKLKTPCVQIAYNHFQQMAGIILSAISRSPIGDQHFWIEDPQGNHFNIIEDKSELYKTDHCIGGVVGAVIGVSNIEKSTAFYSSLTGRGEVIMDHCGVIEDGPTSQTHRNYRRVLISIPPSESGAFCKLFGGMQIELIKANDFQPKKIFHERYWGDCGFIHLCFDVTDMDLLKEKMHAQGFDFSVDSEKSFSMSEASGRFCYVEDPDNTLIELVETHKIPILKKWGINYGLKNRKSQKPLPRWFLGMLALNKVK